MPICSYILYPAKGQELKIQTTLKKKQYVASIHPSTDQSVFILVTETPTEKSEKELKEFLSQCKEIECLTLTYANNEV